MKKLLLMSLCCLLFSISQVFAQNHTVSGVVTAKEDGLSMPGVTVKVKGTTTGTQTNADGKYSITVAPGSTLTFSFIGYTTQEAVVGDKTEINTVLIQDSKQLNEVVVTALGITRESRSLGYAVASVKGDDLTKARETNVLNSLQGKVSGVHISPSSGSLNGGSKIIIRGATSLKGDLQPLIVIDGLPVDNSSQQLQTSPSSVPSGVGSVDFGNRAADIPEDDIESINVLKGAAAAALYGTLAKNGAIIITTKRGKKGAATIDLNTSVRFDNVLVWPKFQNEYAQGEQGIFDNSYLNGWGPKITGQMENQYPNLKDGTPQSVVKAYPDNYKDFFNTGNTYITSLAMSGADDNGDYRVTFDNTEQSGTLLNQKLRKNSISINAGKKLPYGFDIRTNINYTRTFNTGLPVQSSNDPDILGSALFLPRNMDVNNIRDTYLDENGQQNTLTTARNGNNPFWILNNNINSSLVNRVYGNVILSYKPTSWLTFSDNLGTDYYNEFRQSLVRNGTIGVLNGNFFTANLYNRNINNDFIITSDNKITSDLNLKIIAGYNVYDRYYQRDQEFAQTLTIDQLYNFANAGTVLVQNTSTHSRIQGVYGDIGLSYKNFLYLNATGRNDWSSTLPIGKNSYFYPSISSSFVFSELIGPSQWLSSGKLRVSYADVGGDTTPYGLDFQYLPYSSISAQYSLATNFPFLGNLGFYAPGSIPGLDNLKPQNQNTFEVGTELQFFNNRIHTDITYYNNNTTDQIVNLSLPRSTGFSSKLVNAGSLRNKGIEITLGGAPVKTKDFNWNIDVLFSKNIQTVTLPADLPQFSVQNGWSNLIIKAETGKSLGIYGSGWARDPQGNLIIDPSSGLRTAKENVRLGAIDPVWTGSINNTVSYKGFNLSFLIDIHKGGVVFSNTVSALRTSGLGAETAANRGNIFIDKGVIDNGDGTYSPNTVPVRSMEDYWKQYNTDNTEANIFDASFVKLREALLSYDISTSFLQKHAKFFRAASIGIEGRNIWIISKNVPDIDPEVNFFGASSNGSGVEFNSQPSTRTIGFNLRIKI